jgi:hypothetical protein
MPTEFVALLLSRNTRKREQPKPGQAISYDWKGFYSAWGAPYRQIDYLSKPYGVKEGPQAEVFRKQLSQFKTDFEKWGEALAALQGRRSQTVSRPS